MKASELRIGNFVLDMHNNITEVESIISYGINLRGGDGNGIYPDDEIKFIKPIPLTEEWLIKLGFEKIWMNFRKVYDIKQGFGEFVLWKNISTKVLVFKAINKLIEVNSVHHLQNIFYFLTGEELTLKK